MMVRKKVDQPRKKGKPFLREEKGVRSQLAEREEGRVLEK